MLECVVNVSEGRDARVIAGLAAAVSGAVLDVHSDPHHNRSVFTLVGEDAPRALTTECVETLRISTHEGVHPRLGVVDVVPFVPLAGSGFADAVRARDDYAAWLARTHGVPAFLYGTGATLPQLRREAWRGRLPDTGPASPHPTAGAVCVGARSVLVAYNVWLDSPDPGPARRIAAAVRDESVRALGLVTGDHTQVSMNLIAPSTTGPAEAVDRIIPLAATEGVTIRRCELVGLLPLEVLRSIPRGRWEQLDVAEDRSIESRLDAAGISR